MPARFMAPWSSRLVIVQPARYSLPSPGNTRALSAGLPSSPHQFPSWVTVSAVRWMSRRPASVFGGREVAAAVAASHAEDCVAEGDVRPARRHKLSLACASLQGHLEEDTEETVGYFLEQSRQVVVLEPGGLACFGPGSQRGVEPIDGILGRVALPDGCSVLRDSKKLKAHASLMRFTRRI